jgi:hypothetical protein
VPHLASKHMACVPMFPNLKPMGTVFCLCCLMTILCSYVIFHGCIAFWSPLLPDDFLFCRCVPTHLFILTFREIYAISSIRHLMLSDNVLVITMVNHIIFNHEFWFIKRLLNVCVNFLSDRHGKKALLIIWTKLEARINLPNCLHNCLYLKLNPAITCDLKD